jgi:transposase
VQLLNPTEGHAYYDPQIRRRKTPSEAARALKPRLSSVVYHQMVTDATAAVATGPGGRSGTILQSSVTDLTPAAGSSASHFPDPLANSLKPEPQRCLVTEAGHDRVARARGIRQDLSP